MASTGGKKSAKKDPPDWWEEEDQVRAEIRDEVLKELRPKIRAELREDDGLRAEIQKEVIDEMKAAQPTPQQRKRVHEAFNEMEVDALVLATAASEYSERFRNRLRLVRLFGWTTFFVLLVGLAPWLYWLHEHGRPFWTFGWFALGLPWLVALAVIYGVTDQWVTHFKSRTEESSKISSDYFMIAQRLRTADLEIETSDTVKDLQAMLTNRREEKRRIDDVFSPDAKDVRRLRVHIDEQRVSETETAAFLRIAEDDAPGEGETNEAQEVWDPTLTKFTVNKPR